MAKGNKYGYSGGQPTAPKGFGGGNMQSIMQQAQQMQTKMQQAQEELEALEVQGSASGMVNVTCNGKKVISSIQINPQAVDPDDVEMLEDLVLAAINDAYAKAEEKENAIMAPFAAFKGMI